MLAGCRRSCGLLQVEVAVEGTPLGLGEPGAGGGLVPVRPVLAGAAGVGQRAADVVQVGGDVHAVAGVGGDVRVVGPVVRLILPVALLDHATGDEANHLGVEDVIGRAVARAGDPEGGAGLRLIAARHVVVREGADVAPEV